VGAGVSLASQGVAGGSEETDGGGVANRRGEREANGSRELGIQQQTGWNRFFNHGLDDLIPDTEANGGGCLVVYDDEESVKRFDSQGGKGWEESYGTGLRDLIPVSEENGGGYLIAFEHELVRLGQDGSTQWRQTYGEEGVGRGVYSVTEAGSGGFVFVGNTKIDSGPGVSWVAKISEDGTVTWELEQSLLGSRQYNGQTASDVHRANGGGYLIEVGRYRSQWLVKIDESGAIEWNTEFDEYSEIYVTDEGSILVVELEDPRLLSVTAEGTIQWTNEYDTQNTPDQILEGENGILVVRMGIQKLLEMHRDDGTRRWWRTYDRAYTVAHAEPDGYVLFGPNSVLKVNPDGTTEWERPRDVPTAMDYLSNLDGGGYLLGGGEGPSWIALRENLAGGVAVLPDVNGDGNPSQDPDGDGRFEDVNGDGSVNVGDAQALYNNRNSPAVRIKRRRYDFNNDGAVNVGDAQALFSEVTDDN
jgi:hypothetical protein